MKHLNQHTIVVRGAGDLATGVIARLVHAGFRVVALESPTPSAIRRTVCLSEAMYEGRAQVEDIEAIRVDSVDAALALLANAGPSGPVPVLADPKAESLAAIKPLALVDAIIAKRNLGTRRGMAPIVVALGPGFEAGVDADAVIETNRGHHLGRILLSGQAEPNTGVPGIIAGAGRERVLYAPVAGVIENLTQIGDQVEADQAVLAVVGDTGRVLVRSALQGTVRGLIRPGYPAHAGLKVADVDPRCVREHCHTISDKARALGGGVLEAVLMLAGRIGA